VCSCYKAFAVVRTSLKRSKHLEIQKVGFATVLIQSIASKVGIESTDVYDFFERFLAFWRKLPHYLPLMQLSSFIN